MQATKNNAVQTFPVLLILFILLVFCCQSAIASSEKIIFLHHSTGEGVYYEGGVPDWIANYNSEQGTSYQISERNYPGSPYAWQNYPYDYWNLWSNGACDAGNPNIECLDSLTQSYDVIIFKHCFPGSAIEEDSGNPDVSSATKTLENYKLQYRALRDMMDGYPDNLFIVWTLAPLHRKSTYAEEAARARQFVDWVRDEFLTEDGLSHANIALFDFWGIVAEEDPSPPNGETNCLKYAYEQSHISGDSHPNTAANEAAGPEFAGTIIDAIENYFGSAGSDNETGTDGDDDDTGDDDDDEPEDCPASMLLSDDDPRLDMLRHLRDAVLAKSATGRRIIKLYYAHQNRITALITTNNYVQDSARKLLEAALPGQAEGKKAKS